MSVHLKVQAALWAADKACDVIENIQASSEEKANKMDLDELVKKHGVDAVQQTVVVLGQADPSALKGMFGKDDLQRINDFSQGKSDSLYTQKELNDIDPSRSGQSHGDAKNGTQVAESMVANPLAREGVAYAHEFGGLRNGVGDKVGMLDKAQGLMTGDGILDPSDLVSTAALRNNRALALGDAVTMADKVRMKALDEAMGAAGPV